MAEAFSIIKAIDITPSALGKSVSVVIKGLLVILLIAGLGWGIYVTMVKPHIKPTPTTFQEGTITNNYINPTANELTDIINTQIKKQKPKFFLGIHLLGFDIGIQR
jgi:disulfide bond formation protein DsbB